jgi:hypothetical protein
MIDVYASDRVNQQDYQFVKIVRGPNGTVTEINYNTPLPISDPNLDIARGLVPGTIGVVVRGHNPAQTSVSGFVDIAEFGDLIYLTSAETMDIVSTSIADDGAPEGIGLRDLLIEGVDGTGTEISETITLNGTTSVTTVNSYLRVNFLTGLTVGLAGWNVGSIIATATISGTIQAKMDETEGLSQGSHYTVPLGKTFYIVQLELNIAKVIGGGSPTVEFKLYCRSGGVGNSWLQLFDKRLDSAVSNELEVRPPFPSSSNQASAGTDIRLVADTDLNNTEVRTRMYGILIDD